MDISSTFLAKGVDAQHNKNSLLLWWDVLVLCEPVKYIDIMSVLCRLLVTLH